VIRKHQKDVVLFAIFTMWENTSSLKLSFRIVLSLCWVQCTVIHNNKSFTKLLGFSAMLRNFPVVLYTSELQGFGIVCPRQMLFGWPNQLEWDARNMWHMWETGEIFLVGSPDGTRPLGKPSLRLEYNLKWTFEIFDWGHVLDWSGSGQGQLTGCCDCGS
jgi:hypothetical protein